MSQHGLPQHINNTLPAAIPMLSVRPASAPFLPQPDFSVAEILCREKPGDSYWIGLWQTNSCKGSNDIVSQRRNPRYAQAETAKIGKLLFQMELNCRSLLWTDSSRNPLPFNPIKSTSRIHKLSDTLRDTVIGYPSAFSHFKQGKRSLPEWFWRINISKRASRRSNYPV